MLTCTYQFFQVFLKCIFLVFVSTMNLKMQTDVWKYDPHCCFFAAAAAAAAAVCMQPALCSGKASSTAPERPQTSILLKLQASSLRGVSKFKCDHVEISSWKVQTAWCYLFEAAVFCPPKNDLPCCNCLHRIKTTFSFFFANKFYWVWMFSFSWLDVPHHSHQRWQTSILWHSKTKLKFLPFSTCAEIVFFFFFFAWPL